MTNFRSQTEGNDRRHEISVYLESYSSVFSLVSTISELSIIKKLFPDVFTENSNFFKIFHVLEMFSRKSSV